MRRTLGTDLQEHGTLKDAQGALRHASIRTTGDVYMQTIESSVLQRDELQDHADPCRQGKAGHIKVEDAG
jgi:integrase